MPELTCRERVTRILNLEPVDQVAVFEQFWPDTCRKWVKEGYLKEDESPIDHFDMDLDMAWAFSMVADLQSPEEVIEENDETRLVRTGNKAILRYWKSKSGTPEHVDFEVRDRKGWLEHIRPKLVDENTLRNRINFEVYRERKAKSEQKNQFFCWAGVNAFECMHPVCGHEYMLMGMALDPDWVKDMVNVYCDMTIKMMEILFTQEGKPDGIWFFEDMGFKHKPFMSPQMYDEIVKPGHARTFDYAHSIGCKVIMHSCGFVEPLVPSMIDAGMDCLQAMEVKAGMDLLRIKKKFGDTIALCGGLDIRELETNDKSRVDRLLEENIPHAAKNSGYILHTDHSVPDTVEYQTYKYFVERGRQISSNLHRQ